MTFDTELHRHLHDSFMALDAALSEASNMVDREDLWEAQRRVNRVRDRHLGDE